MHNTVQARGGPAACSRQWTFSRRLAGRWHPKQLSTVQCTASRQPNTGHRPAALDGSPGGAAAGPAAAWQPGDGEEGSLVDQSVSQLKARLEAAVRAELQEQQQQQASAYRGSSVRRLQADGLVLLGLAAAPRDRLFADFVWAFAAPDRGRLPYHRFKRGDTVLLAPMPAGGGRGMGGDGGGDAQQQGEGQALEGTMLEVKGGEVLVTVSKAVSQALEAAPRGTLWRLDQGTSSASAQRQLAALSRLGRCVDPGSERERAVMAILLRSPQAEALAAEATEWARDAAWRAVAGEELNRHGAGLNQSQLNAVAAATTRTFTLWQGPPGTGKTRTLIAFVETMVRAAARAPVWRRRQGALLAVADTNAAADNLLEGMLQQGIPAVRVGQPAKVREELRHACVDARVEATAAGQRAKRFRRDADTILGQLRQARQVPARGRADGPPPPPELLRDWQRRADDLLREADRLVADAAVDLLQRAPVVVATCNGAGEARLEGQPFRVVVLDEAGQATEPASLVPLLKGAQCVVMAGDQMQLPPTVLSQGAVRLGLDVPLFNRLLQCGVASRLLEVQYRMHPAIADFPSRHFYGGRVRSGVGHEARPPVRGVPWSNPRCPVLFINVEGREQRSAAGDASWANPAEAQLAMKALVRILQEDQEVATITLLGQVRLLTAQLTALLASGGLPEGAAQRCTIEVSTVDGYQGREADAVIFSAVRSNPKRQVGFLADQRRLNVAITRARRGLFVIGNQPTLANDPNWLAWMSWVAAQRALRGRQGQQAQPEAASGQTRPEAAEAVGQQARPKAAEATDGQARPEAAQVAGQLARPEPAAGQQARPEAAGAAGAAPLPAN